MSVPMTLSDLERRDARGQIIQVDLLNNACSVSPRTTKFHRITRVGRGVYLEVSDAPTVWGLGLSAPNFGGSLLFMHTPFDAELPNLTW